VESINLNATDGLRQQALIDAKGENYLFFLANTRELHHGQAFVRAHGGLFPIVRTNALLLSEGSGTLCPVFGTHIALRIYTLSMDIMAS